MSDDIKAIQQFDFNKTINFDKKDDKFIDRCTIKIKYEKNHRPETEDFGLATQIFMWSVLYVQKNNSEELRKQIKVFLHGWVDEL